ncbi:hypothetical protein HBH61_198610 [Parastagonospora nodorum]|nr:hypothetical protein HBI09_191550 [Parastagonospora nodorum]KAH4801241.1 hypothetical protein HBH61_198610 [Parastagonospora nodorum]KAH4991861.1 hypothetical protein HBI77_211700 [Parastagonospora nodorum]KAH5667424.1 hypothetical protein HBI44_220890 [Parastagonospora nodorum]KAH5668930.1 hypothetical protein HBI21_205850 [Parastagonospora nodorum]
MSSARVRKACLQCIRAKAKCSTSEHRPDECHRCVRLNKQCAFEVVAKKPGPGPKSRSRVRQLEQRVESLMDLISAKNTEGTSTLASPSTTPIQVATPETSAVSNTPTDDASCYSRSLTHTALQSAAFRFYDPVDAGAISEERAYRLLDEFKQHFVWAFPFIVVDVDGPTLRRQEPFLFHAILTVTAYDTPGLQYVLSDKLRHEIGRVVEHSKKSLGILQGLLVYGGWYHGFYHPASQQLTMIVHLCMAMVQDLGLSKNRKPKPVRRGAPVCGGGGTNQVKGTMHEKRALLGTYFLTVTFAQAWRQRTIMPYTRFMAQTCDAFESSAVLSDTLIRPLVKASELLSRANDHFSYSDIDNAEVRGAILISMSTNNFLAELQHIKDFISFFPLLKDNTTLILTLSLVEIGINEVCLHTSLWSTSSLSATTTLCPTRLKMLHRSMQGATSYLRTLIQTPQPLLYRLGLGSWTGWFYVFVLMCKLVFLEENERLGETEVDDLPEEINNLTPEGVEPDRFKPHDTNVHGTFNATTASGGMVTDPTWNAIALTEQYGLCQLSDQVMKKLTFSLPEDFIPWQKPRGERHSLYPVSCLHKIMLQGLTKRIERLKVTDDTILTGNQAAAAPVASTLGSTTAWQVPHTNSDDVRRVLTMPFNNFMNFDSLNFDGITLPSTDFSQGGQEWGDIMWDMAMDDFTMPQL